MRKQKGMGNKGFSLVELIIVIAIMAILIGVMAPQLLRYVERTRVSSDTQLADSVRTAVRTAMMDPVVLNDATSTAGIATFYTTAVSQATAVDLSTLTGDEFVDAIEETLGVTALGDVANELQSTPLAPATTLTISVWSINGNDIGVVILGSDDGTGNPIVVQ